MSWGLITEDWRLKLLALGLAVLMLGAVAFSQNPPTTGSRTVGLSYSVSPAIILINPPSSTTVYYSGLADVIKNVSTSNLVASVDATHASPGSAVKLNISARSLILGVTVQNPPPIAVDIDTFQTKDLQVQVNARAQPGWSITKAAAQCPASPCVVHFGGPASWEKNMTASVVFPSLVAASTSDSLNQPIAVANSNGLLDLTTCRTQPCATLDVLAASIHVEAVAGSTSSTVALLDSPPSHPPPSGYRITAITITPNTVTITGDPAALAKIRSISLPPVDLSRSTSDATFTVAIPYPDGTSGSVANATVTYSISPNPNVSPSP